MENKNLQQATKILPALFQSDAPLIITNNDGTESVEVSIYKSEEASTQKLIWAAKVLRACYPETPKEAFEIIIDKLKEKGWGDVRITDAVNHVIENHVYRTINPANILSYDKRKKLYRYADVLNEINKEYKWEQFEKVEVAGVKYFQKK